MPHIKLPIEIQKFTTQDIEPEGESTSLSVDQYEELHKIELKDVQQQIKMRPIVATFFGVLLVAQNTVVFLLVAWALKRDYLDNLQLVFSALIAGTLAQTYKISELIVNKLFEPIDYADKFQRFNKD